MTICPRFFRRPYRSQHQGHVTPRVQAPHWRFWHVSRAMKMRRISGLLLCLGLCIGVSACAILDNARQGARQGAQKAGFAGIFTPRPHSAAATRSRGSVTSDYLKARLAARHQALDVAADAYSRAAIAVPDDLNLIRHAFFYDLAAGRPKDALAQARALAHRSAQSDRQNSQPSEPPKAREEDEEEAKTTTGSVRVEAADDADKEETGTSASTAHGPDKDKSETDTLTEAEAEVEIVIELQTNVVPGVEPHDSFHPDTEDQKNSEALVGVRGVHQSGADLPLLLQIADTFVTEDYDLAQRLLERPFSNDFSESLVHLLRAWLAVEAEDVLAALKIIQSEQPGLFTGFSALHQGYLLEIAREPIEARKAYEAAADGFNAPLALQAFAGFLERESRKNPDLNPEAVAVHRNLAIQQGALRRVGRLGLARMGDEDINVTRNFSRLAARMPPRQVKTSRDGAALVFYHFAQSALERALAERFALSQLRLRPSAFSSLNTPLALAQIALYLDPELHDARYLIGSVYTDYGMNAAAVATYHKIPFANAQYVFAQLDSIRPLEELERTDDVFVTLKSLLKNDPHLPEAAMIYADILSREGMYDEARAHLTRAITYVETLSDNDGLSQSLWRLYFARGASEIEEGAWERGEEDMQKAAKLAPEEPLVLNYLGYSWVERGVNLKQAFDMIEKAVSLRPHSGAIIDSLGWAYYQLGEYEEAVKHLERAVEFEPADPTVTEHLGDVYWQLDRKIEAKYQWRHVLTLAPGEVFEARIRDKIAYGIDAKSIPDEL